jgi:hypothetical protein
MGAVLTVVSLLLSVFFYQKKHRMLYILSMMLAYLGFNALLSFRGGDISSNEGINRIVNGLSSFAQNKSSGMDDNSTVSLSEKLLDSYFYRSPLIGNGLSVKGDDYIFDIDSKTNSLRSLKTDARLAFVIIDIGLIGLFLYMLLFFQLFKYMGHYLTRKGRLSLIIVYIFFLVFSVTESGFWDAFAYPLIFVFYFALIEFEGEEKRVFWKIQLQ